MTDSSEKAEAQRKIQLLKETAEKIAEQIQRNWHYRYESQPDTITQVYNILRDAQKEGINYDNNIIESGDVFLYFVDWRTRTLFWTDVCAPKGNVNAIQQVQLNANGKVA